MRRNRLQLNIDKTGQLWCLSFRRQHQLLSAPLSFGGNTVTASSVVRKRGVFVDSDLSLRHHVESFMSSLHDFVSCANIRGHVSVPMTSLLTSLILTLLIYYNSVLFRLPDVLVSRLQSFQNAAARVSIFVGLPTSPIP
jgi:hypothetical protein